MNARQEKDSEMYDRHFREGQEVDIQMESTKSCSSLSADSIRLTPNTESKGQCMSERERSRGHETNDKEDIVKRASQN